MSILFLHILPFFFFLFFQHPIGYFSYECFRQFIPEFDILGNGVFRNMLAAIGQKLFFVTFAVEGRRPVLSRLVDEKSRPQLLPMGEVVRAALRALHLVRASAGISDYVIMPDHVHFIMRVDCDRDKIASPLWLTHRMLDAVECAVRDGVGEPVDRLDVPADNALHLIQGVRNVFPPGPLPRLHNQYLHGASSFWSGTTR